MHIEKCCMSIHVLQGARRGELARHRLRGKRAIELGAGTGLAGLALAMLSCDVVLTDTSSILRLLQMNYDANLSPAACSGDLDKPLTNLCSAMLTAWQHCPGQFIKMQCYTMIGIFDV